MKLADVLIAAPPTPACFPSRSTWAEYLHECQKNTSRKLRQPFAEGVYQPSFDFCRDCTKDHAEAMSNAGQCKPHQFNVLVVAIRRVPECS